MYPNSLFLFNPPPPLWLEDGLVYQPRFAFDSTLPTDVVYSTLPTAGVYSTLPTVGVYSTLPTVGFYSTSYKLTLLDR